jgi:PKD repeat protein
VRGQAIAFNGSGSSDPDGDTLTYAWDFGDGATGTGAAPTHAYATVGTFTLTLVVNDGQASSAPATATVTINNQAPSANAGGPYSGVRQQSIAFSGSGNDPDGDNLTYAWDFGDGATGTGATPIHAYASLGTYTAILVVSDGYTSSAPSSATVTITNRNPVANAGGPYAGVRGQAITFNGTGSSDPDGDPLTYAWNFGDGATGTGATPTHAYASLGTFTVTLTVNDGYTNSAPATTTVTISNRPPVANAGPDKTVQQRTNVTLDGRGSLDPDGAIVAYAWRQVSGPPVTLSGANTSVATFAAPKVGSGTATLVFELTVTDNNGAMAADQVVVTVTR